MVQVKGVGSERPKNGDVASGARNSTLVSVAGPTMGMVSSMERIQFEPLTGETPQTTPGLLCETDTGCATMVSRGVTFVSTPFSAVVRVKVAELAGKV
jgi:hypothetical protein